MYLLDTNICIAIIQGNSSAVAQFQQKYQDCYLSTLVLGELYKGVYCSSLIQQNILILNQFVNQLIQVDFAAFIQQPLLTNGGITSKKIADKNSKLVEYNPPWNPDYIAGDHPSSTKPPLAVPLLFHCYHSPHTVH